jgi:uncharacterized protein YndB with AHSA1/START domain
MSESTFRYAIYIATTPEKGWEAITRGEVTRQYWEHANVSDWKVGSKWEHLPNDGRPALIVGEVLEVAPPNRLVISWSPPAVDEVSRVTFDITQVKNMVKLTVIHERLVAGSTMERSISEGWPRVLSSMKTLLETGKPLDTWAGKEEAARAS